jgi:hypothetical protein
MYEAAHPMNLCGQTECSKSVTLLVARRVILTATQAGGLRPQVFLIVA